MAAKAQPARKASAGQHSVHAPVGRHQDLNLTLLANVRIFTTNDIK
ncbi:hypothetical protein KC799_06810 [candidate division KSB1 bacterium]|nr:hypothetical protein [candidate division KSB1 bacterium]